MPKTSRRLRYLTLRRLFLGVPIGLELNFYVCKYDLNLADTVVLYHVKIQDFDQSYKNSYKFYL